MSSLAKNTSATIIPGMHYRDAAAAIEWLCDTFGFEKHAVHRATAAPSCTPSSASETA
jgi:uncharacterized glyoxalase superfamily protein PhnB